MHGDIEISVIAYTTPAYGKIFFKKVTYPGAMNGDVRIK